MDSVSKSYNVTKRESFSFLKKMTGTNRNRLIRDLGRIKTAYLTFLGAVATKGKKLLTSTRTEFQKYGTEFKKLWVDMHGHVKTWTEKIQKLARNFVGNIMHSLNTGTTQMAAGGAAMIATLKATFAGFNFLDILTSGGKIRDWSLRVVMGLQRAFAGTNPFDKAIEVAARNSRSIIDSMASAREGKGTAKPIAKMTWRQISSEGARGRAKNDLIAATHEPAWSKKVIEQNETTNTILQNGFRTLLMLQGSRSQQRSAQRTLAEGFNLTDDAGLRGQDNS